MRLLVVISCLISIIRNPLVWDRPLTCHFISVLMISFKFLILLWKFITNSCACAQTSQLHLRGPPSGRLASLIRVSPTSALWFTFPTGDIQPVLQGPGRTLSLPCISSKPLPWAEMSWGTSTPQHSTTRESASRTEILSPNCSPQYALKYKQRKAICNYWVLSWKPHPF